MSITSSYGFRSAQAAYENASPYGDECDCQPLFACENCDHMALEGGECPECKGEADSPIMMEEVERTEHYEGTLTDSRCDIHNHVCTSRDCCD